MRGRARGMSNELDITNPTGDPSEDRLGALLDPFMEVFSDESLPEAIRKKGLQVLIDLRCQFLAFIVWGVQLKSDAYDKELNDVIQPLSVMLDLLYKSYVRTGNIDLLVSSLEETVNTIADAFQSEGSADG